MSVKIKSGEEDSNLPTARVQYDDLLKQGGFTDHYRYRPIYRMAGI